MDSIYSYIKDGSNDGGRKQPAEKLPINMLPKQSHLGSTAHSNTDRHHRGNSLYTDHDCHQRHQEKTCTSSRKCAQYKNHKSSNKDKHQLHHAKISVFGF